MVLYNNNYHLRMNIEVTQLWYCITTINRWERMKNNMVLYNNKHQHSNNAESHTISFNNKYCISCVEMSKKISITGIVQQQISAKKNETPYNDGAIKKQRKRKKKKKKLPQFVSTKQSEIWATSYKILLDIKIYTIYVRTMKKYDQ